MASHQPLDHEGLQFHIHDDLQLATPPTDPELLYEPQPTAHQHHPEFPPGKSQPIRRVGCLRRSTFWLTLALAIVTIIAAVGGGFGGSLAVKSASRHPSSAAALPPTTNQTANGTATQLPAPTSFATAALTNFSVPAPRTVESLELDCPNTHDTYYTSAATGFTFSKWCDHDYPVGLIAEGINASVKDIMAIIAYAMDDCIEACSSMNAKSLSNACAGIAFNSNMSLFPTGNCWLKDKVGPGLQRVKSATARLVK